MWVGVVLVCCCRCFPVMIGFVRVPVETPPLKARVRCVGSVPSRARGASEFERIVPVRRTRIPHKRVDTVFARRATVDVVAVTVTVVTVLVAVAVVL